jgi:lysyl-tRNA synthetase class 2
MRQEYRQSEEFVNRLRKLQELREIGIDPYPAVFHPSHDSGQLLGEWNHQKIGGSAEAERGDTPSVSVAGRLVLFRPMGKNTFGHIQDKSGRIQVMFNKDHSLVDGFFPHDEELTHQKLIEKKFDLGDIIGVEGNLFHTQKGELTIFVKKVKLLTKSLLPLPDKHSGLNDKEIRYRKRWLDLISNPSVQKVFTDRSRILQLIRQHFAELGFLEVETPVLGSLYGGAEAKPFTTELHALHQEMFLRISPEINLKKILVGGLERVFEIGKVFRNEGIDRTHNPEFTMLEAYAAYWDYTDMMHLTETLFEKIALALHDSTEVSIFVPETQQTVIVDFKTPWKRMTMKESIEVYAGISCDALTDEQMKAILRADGMEEKELAESTRGLLIAHLFETKVEHKLIQPHHIIDHPIETTPLCKPHRDPVSRKEGLIERFETFILGSEICNAYSELNDPELQRSLLEKQSERRQKGDEEASPYDEEFVEALCQGMPPAGGLGIGIDRLVMLFTNAHSIRDILFFPWMKPRSTEAEEGESEES